MGGVPKVTTEERFRRHFEKFGTIDRVELNAERSFGFVTFAHAAMVDAVLETRMHQFEHAEHQTSFVEVRRPKPRGNQFKLTYAHAAQTEVDGAVEYPLFDSLHLVEVAPERLDLREVLSLIHI